MDRELRVASATAEAEQLTGLLPGDAWATLFGVAARVYDKDRAARARVRLVDGRWLLLHAARLHISRHTLRDHVKAIFAKVGAKSRSELTALVGGGSAPDLV
jgi:hypothetical protein